MKTTNEGETWEINVALQSASSVPPEKVVYSYWEGFLHSNWQVHWTIKLHELHVNTYSIFMLHN